MSKIGRYCLNKGVRRLPYFGVLLGGIALGRAQLLFLKHHNRSPGSAKRGMSRLPSSNHPNKSIIGELLKCYPCSRAISRLTTAALVRTNYDEKKKPPGVENKRINKFLSLKTFLQSLKKGVAKERAQGEGAVDL